MNDGHLEGCSRTHRHRQQCDGPAAEPVRAPDAVLDASAVADVEAASSQFGGSPADGLMTASGSVIAAPASGGAMATAPPSPRYIGYAAPPRRLPPPPPAPPVNFDYSPLRAAWRDAVAWIAAIVSTITLLIAISVAGVYVAVLSEDRAEPMPAVGVVAICFAVGAILGIGLPYWLARAWALVLLAMISLTFVTGGPALIVAAFVIRQMESPDVAQDRGFVGLMAFGIVTTALGIAIAIWLVSLLRNVDIRRGLARWANGLAAAYGVLIGATGAMTALALVFFINSSGYVDNEGNDVSVIENVIAVTLVAASLLVPGVILTWHSISSGMGVGSGKFSARPAVWLLAAYGAVMLTGHWIMIQESPIAAPMPLLHVLAAALPGLTLSAMAARGSLLRGTAIGGLTWRQVTLSAGISMGVATVMAVYVEGIGSVYGIILLLVHNGAFVDITSFAEFNDILAEAEFLLTENEQFIAGLITAALLAPLIEEFAKSLGARFTMSPWTTRGQAFVLGAYAGAAFGFVEALSYGLIGISDDLADWWQIMLLRGGSTSLHVICSGLAGAGWWYWTRASQHRTAITLWTASVLIHAGWNGFFTAIYSRVFVLDTLSNRTLEIVAYAVVIVVSLMMIAAIPLTSRRLRDDPPPPADDTPLGAMTPWLA